MNSLLKVLELDKGALKNAYESLCGFALILTIALAVVLVVTYVALRVRKSNEMNRFKSVSLGIVIGYTVTISACVSFFMIARLVIKDEINTSFYLVLGFLGLCLVYVTFLGFTNLFSEKSFRICNFVGIFLIVAYLIALVFAIPTSSEEYKPLSTAGMYIFSGLIIAVAVALTLVFGKDNGSTSPTKAIAHGGIAIAVAFALSYIKLFSLPQGGSVTLASMLPIIVYAYIFGARKGLLIGAIYGVLQCLQSPQIYQPMQVVLDYLIAFGVLGVAGIVKNIKFLKTPLVKFIFGASLACLLRYFCHVLSGYYVFSSWAMEGYSALAWGFVYNLYVIVDLAIVVAVGCVLFGSKGIYKQINRINPLYQSKDEK